MAGFSTRVMRDEDWAEIRHFKASEFKHPYAMGYEFMKWLDMLRAQADVPIVITSSYRSQAHNARIGGATDSAHTDIPCCAVDIGERPRKDDPSWNYSRWMIISTAIMMGCKRIGIYADGSIHLDMSHHKRPSPRMWRVVR